MDLKNDIKKFTFKKAPEIQIFFFLDTVPPKGEVKTLVNSLNYILKITYFRNFY